MGSGNLKSPVLNLMVNSLRKVPGDLAEIGVYKGDLFKRLIWIAQAQGKVAHAFDSFQGMGRPGEHDRDDYPEGRFALPCGMDTFVEILASEGFEDYFGSDYFIWPGFIPRCFVNCAARFSFVYIDVDHHNPTEQAINWAWPLLNIGGLIGFDDYFPGRKYYASPPIDRFLIECEGKYEEVLYDNDQLFVRKINA